jgi:hypothetical protein
MPKPKLSGPVLRLAMEHLLAEAGKGVAEFDQKPEDSAHFIRTRVKRLQSLSRLVPRGREWRQGFLVPCRELKDLFAEVRDATIVRGLAERFAPGEAAHLRAVEGPDLAVARSLIRAAEKSLHDFPDWEKIGVEGLEARFAGTYRAAREAGKSARRARVRDAVFHNWRRRVKRLLYQSEFLERGKKSAKLTTKIDRLGEVLGELQDICMAEEWLSRHGIKSPPEDLARSKEHIRRQALQLGEKLFRQKPAELF